MSAPKVTVYTSPSCASCEAAKRFLDGKGVGYSERDMTDPETMEELQKVAPGAAQAPVILVGDQAVQGFDKARLEDALARN